MEKRTRIVNPELCALVRTLPCMACQKAPAGEAHHVTTRKAGGHDVWSNLMPLCTQHHYEWHFSGPSKLIEKYPVIRNWLEAAGRQDILERANRGR